MPTISGAKLTRRVVVRAVPAMRRAFLKAVAKTLNGTAQPAILAALRTGDLDAAIDAVPWDRLASPVIQGELMDTFADSFRESGRLSIQAVDASAPFAILDERPMRYLQRHGADLVSKFGLENRDALRDLLTQHFADGVPGTQTARAIERTVGLTKPWAKAVENRRGSLMAQADALGLSAAEIDAQVDQYAKELRLLRATNIANTEAQIAINEGQREAWDQAAEQGLMDRDKAVRIWKTARDEVVRDEHMELEGQARKLGVPFQIPSSGREVAGPPDGVNCRCTEDLIPEGRPGV